MAATPSRPRRNSWMFSAAGLLLLAILIAILTVHTDRSARDFDARVINAAPGLIAPRFFLDHDAYAWLVHARDLMKSGDWRIRHTYMDNTPFGRPMHWSHLLIWGIQGLTTLFMRANAWPIARALDLAGVWIMPAFQFLLLSLACVLFLRKLGWGAAGLFALLCLSLEPLSSVFHPLKPDHHGLQAFSVFLSFFCLAAGGMGWVQTAGKPHTRPPPDAFVPLTASSPADARRWFAAAGIFGAVSLWLGGTVWIFSLAITVAAALCAMPAARVRPAPQTSYVPGLWRIWAGAGAAAAVFFHLLEYAPHHFSMRLEVNHPLYALCWLGTAECMVFVARSASWRFWQNRPARDWALMVPGLLAALALPAAILLGPAAWHVLRNPATYHWNDRVIAEFTPGLLVAARNWRNFLPGAFGLLPAVLVALAISNPSDDDARPVRRAFAAFTILFGLLFLRQLRWLPFLVLPLAGWTVLWLNQRLTRPGIRSTLALALCGVLLLNGAWAMANRFKTEARIARGILPPEAWGKALASKHTALRTGIAAGTTAWRMIGTPDDAPCLYYFAGIPSVASFYWENLDGWLTELDFYCDRPGGRVAEAIVRERGLTHALALLEPERRDLFAVADALAMPLAPPVPPDETLAHAMARSGAAPAPPPWMAFDKNLSAVLSERILLSTPAGYVHLQKPISFFVLTPPPLPDTPPD